MTDIKATPATDEEIAVLRHLGYMCVGCDPKAPSQTHGSACIFAMEPKLLARIAADAETIKAQGEEIAALRADIASRKWNDQ